MRSFAWDNAKILWLVQADALVILTVLNSVYFAVLNYAWQWNKWLKDLWYKMNSLAGCLLLF